MGSVKEFQDAIVTRTEVRAENTWDAAKQIGTVGYDLNTPLISQQDLDQVWKWNATIPDQEQGCVHDLIHSWAKSQPDALAVCAWDGDFTYAQLDRLASNLASRLLVILRRRKQTAGNGPQQTSSPKIIPILFNKSRWTCVAMLGAIKAGCAVIALDASMPDGRLRSIVQQARPELMLSSVVLGERAKLLVGDDSGYETYCFQLDESSLETLDITSNEDPPSFKLPVVSPSDIVYVSFTSGSTGQPKGACISHANVCSAVLYQGPALGFHRAARVFDFAPYSFDVAWSNFLHTLCAGGCLCIASEAAMLDDLSSSITSLQATLINITPTVLRTLHEAPECLETVLMSGEMPYPDNVSKWAGRVRLLNTYGPSECTFKCAFSVLGPGTAGERPDIGRGVGFATWLVDPHDCTRLVPIGAVGELYLEGPLVGQGYLNDSEKTAAAFVSNAPWLVAADNKFCTNRSSSRLYKTGDLVRYKHDGSLYFVGRKDASQQLKIRGQRVEIGDVEHHVRSWLDQKLSVIVDVIVPRDSDRASLALFVAVDEKKQRESEELKRIVALIDGLTKHLQDALPAFMIPTIYLPVDEIPVTPTGKVNRRLLVEKGNAMTWEKIVALQRTILPTTEFQEPSTAIEGQLRDIWAQVLGLDVSIISTGDNFFHLGGDSISAIGVVAACREADLTLAVSDLFKTPVLRDLAIATTFRQAEQDTIVPFSCLAGSRTDELSLKDEAARLCGIDSVEIEDIYPCTPLQQGMLAMAADNRGQQQTSYVSRTAFKLPAQVDVEKFEVAWASTVELAAIIRTRIIELDGEGLVQVVLKCPPLTLPRYLSINGFFDGAAADHTDMGLGSRLYRAGIVTSATQEVYFVLEMHHAIFDGWSTSLILETVEAAYTSQLRQSDDSGVPLPKPLRPFTPYQHFIKHIAATNGSSKAVAYWREQLSDSVATVFPGPNESPLDSYTEEKLDVRHKVSNLQWLTHSGITPSSVVRSSISLLLAQYTNSDDVKYGATVSGRNAAVAGIDRMAGPTIATVPVRVKFDWAQTTVKSLMQQVQQQAVIGTEYEQFGLQNIHRIDAQMADASRFQLLLVVQPASSRKKGTGRLFSQALSVVGNTKSDILTLVPKDAEADSVGIYNPYAMMVIVQLQDDGLDLNINFDSATIDQPAVQRIASQLEYIIRQLCTETLAESKVRDIIAASAEEVKQIWTWNGTLPENNQQTVTSMIDNRAAVLTTEAASEAIAVSAWDQKLTYPQLRDLTTKLAQELRDYHSVSPGSIVVLSFEKSSWLVVCMIAALKAGAVVLPMSIATSTRHASEVVKAVNPKLVIFGGSPTFSNEQVAPASPFQGLVATLAISSLIESLSSNEGASTVPRLSFDEQVVLCPSDPALILFTSGSTGAPKSILWTHANLSSNISAHAAAFNVTSSTRTFQFAGYDFDVSTVESLSILASGGCLCIPSEADRTNRLEIAIQDTKANWLCLTPSVSETLGGPQTLPELKTLVFAGEKLTGKTASKWKSSFGLDVYNWYGPAEASVATSCLVNAESWKPGVIGKGLGRTWLVNPSNPDILAPIGAVAELCIEGPFVASYTGQSGASLNKKSFCSPSWLLYGPDGRDGTNGRSNGCASAALYKTGDLVKYHGTDGSLVFVGRTHDTQRKLRGFRIELGEIELRVQDFLSRSGRKELEVMTVVAEIFCPANSATETLALFVSPGIAATDSNIDAEGSAVAFVKQFLPVNELEEELLGTLPMYMIPKVYIPIPKIPIGRTGKTDRRRLRETGSSLTYESLAAIQPSRFCQNDTAREPSTKIEKQLQRLWATVIGILDSGLDSINATSNFLRLGGDSIGAMRLVALARNQGLNLTVKDVFEAPRLEDMARRIKLDPEEQQPTDQKQLNQQPPAPFSLINPVINEVEARAHAARLCSVSEEQVVDIYPCTALQQGLLALGAKRHGQYVSRSVLRLQPGIDAERLQRAWLAAVQRLPLLRTRIVDLPGQGFVQVVLRDLPLRSYGSGSVEADLDSYVAADALEAMGPGTALCRAAIIDGQHFVLTIHHCTYDGSVLKMILDELEQKYYLTGPEMPVTPFSSFIQYLTKTDPHEAAAFWKRQLSSDKEPRQFPALPSVSYIPKANANLNHSISLPWPRRSGITPSTILRATWSILAAQYTSSADVIFALTVSGRQADMRGIESCVGPTISTVPMTVAVDWTETVHGFLEKLQTQMVAMTPFEHFGLQNLQHLENCLDVVDARLLQTLLVVQPAKGQNDKSLDEDSLLFQKRSFASNAESEGTDPFNSYALMVMLELENDGLQMKMSFDDKVISSVQMGAMARQFEGILKQICFYLSTESEVHASDKRLGTIQTASDQDLDLFWSQNQKLPADPDKSVQSLISQAAHQQPEQVVIDAWDGKFTYSQVDEISTELSRGLIALGVRKGQVVGLNFEKSRWAPINQLAVFKTGAVAVQVSVAVPEARKSRIFKNLGVALVVVGHEPNPKSRPRNGDVVCYTPNQILEKAASVLGSGSRESQRSIEPVVDVEMQDPAAIIVSSGSTGEPKQFGWSHRALAANVRAYGQFAALTGSTRLFQFASYDFDVANVESMAALVYGSCLCIPSEAERLDGTASVIRRTGANLLSLTPSVAKSLCLEDVPLVETIVFAGENLTRDDVNRWKDAGNLKKRRVLNWYGPAEHTGTWTTVDVDQDTDPNVKHSSWHNGVIGNINPSQMGPQPTLCWLVDPINHDRLVPFGAIGEIALEGPLCADGYIGNLPLTERQFRCDPEFLTAGHTINTNNTTQRVPGRRGRIFFSGDLARYDLTTGNLVYMGRKDKQLKVRGQLVAPEEVQRHIREHLTNVSLADDVTVIVDVIPSPRQYTAAKATASNVLVAFVGPATEVQVESATTELRDKLAAVLPSYAIPVYFIPIASFPRNASAKLDSHALRQIGAAFDPSRQLAAASGNRISRNRRDPTTTAERALRELWSLTLGIDAEQIKADESFLRVGDSIQAMRLVSFARQQGLRLTVAEIFERPTLKDMAKVLGNLHGVDDACQMTMKIAPFSLLGPDQDVRAARQHAAELCGPGIDAEDIEDMFPCTSLQEGLLALTIKNQSLGLGNSYTGYNILELVPSIDLNRFRDTWNRVIDMFPILRTRIIELPRQGLVQAIIQTASLSRLASQWADKAAILSVDDWLIKEKDLPMALGTPLMRYALLSNKGKNYFALSMHHSIYDGQTTPLILEALETMYHGTNTPLRHVPFQVFVKYISEQDKATQADFWKDQFKDLEAEQFPALSSSQYHPQTNSTLSLCIEHVPWRPSDNTTPSTIIRAATALLCAQYSGNSSDVVFGAVSDGRRAPVGGIERLAGPTIATVPIRVNMRGVCMEKLLADLQAQAVTMIPHEQTGLSSLRQVGGRDAEQACRFQTLLVVQPAQEKMTMMSDSSGNGLFVSEYHPEDAAAAEPKSGLPQPDGICDEEDMELARHHDFQSYALSLICTPGADQLKITFCFDSAVIPREMMRRMSQGFEHFIRILCSPDRTELSAPFADMTLTTKHDLAQIWSWNSSHAHDSVDSCIHDLITQVAQKSPDAVAIRAWDGEMSYIILDGLTSHIARHLMGQNVNGLRGVTVPLCFEKSMFAVVALLSVIKAGGAGLLLDTTLPESRLLEMVQQVNFGAGLVLSSPLSRTLAEKLAGMDAKVVLVGLDELETFTQNALQNSQPPGKEEFPLPPLPCVHSSDLICTIFTSGSTGKPKGCLLTHGNFSSAVKHQRATLQLNSTSRMYDFASHAFDATYWAAFHVLTAGGTLCIPSDEDRKTRLTESMCQFGATHLFLTPSVARLVDPAGVPTLKSVHLGGEEVTRDDVSRWLPYTKEGGTFVAYGPSECTAGTLYYRVTEPLTEGGPLPIGKGVGASTWIVKPSSSSQEQLRLCDLSPIGTIGELYLGGPLVGQGYLGAENAGKTVASFIECPDWFLQGRGKACFDEGGRIKSQMLYKTGDLVKYDPASDGNIIFLGRKDRQVKLRGQKVELPEVEHYIWHCLASTSKRGWLQAVQGVAVEVVTPSVTETPALVAFIQLRQTGHQDEELPESELLHQLAYHIETNLPKHLPRHMVPVAYIAIASIPLSASGKTDRKQLLEIGKQLTPQQLTRNSVAKMEDESNGLRSVAFTEREVVLRGLWMTVLRGVQADEIRQESSFLRMGGDSISAMRLTALAQSHGIRLPVKDILQLPRLSEMAKAMKMALTTTLDGPSLDDARSVIEPFSLLKATVDKNAIKNFIATQYPDIKATKIEDVYPCTSVQKSLLSMTAKSASGKSYVARFSIQLRQDIDVARFQAAWEHVNRNIAPILRTRIIDAPAEGGLVQVQLDEGLEWDHRKLQTDVEGKEKSHELAVAQYLSQDRSKPMGLGTPLTRLAIIGHHAVYDGYSVQLLLTEVSKAYLAQDTTLWSNSSMPIPAPFQVFIKHVMAIDKEQATSFWLQQFAGSEAVPFPPLPSEDYRPQADKMFKRSLANMKWPKTSTDATASTIIRAAWSILTARYTGSADVVFGAIVSGRQAPLAGIDRMIAPLISAVPVRIRFDPAQSLGSLLDDIQRQALAMIAYEQVELLDIRRMSVEAERGSQFNTLLVVQPASPEGDGLDDGKIGPWQQQAPEFVSDGNGLDDFNPNGVMIMCQLTNTGGLELEISFDSHVLDAAQMDRIGAQFEHVLRQMCTSDMNTPVEEIITLSAEDLNQLWEWNGHAAPEPVEECVHHLICATMARQPCAPAICAWDGTLSYGELDSLSGRLAKYLASLGAGPGSIIPLCFEKSMWHPVAVLGAMRAGAVCVAIDSTQPVERIQSIVRQVNPEFVLCSVGNEELAGRLSGARVVVVDQARVDGYETSRSEDNTPKVKVCADDVLYVVFTSGSTGEPKGIITTHRNFASAALYQREILQITHTSRVFDFVSYSFDVSWSNHLQTFVCGGCLCIPSETERRNDIPSAFNRMKCDYVYFTPSVAMSLEPSTMPGIKVLAMGGEPILGREVARWTTAKTPTSEPRSIIGIYGPAECAQALCFIRLGGPKTRDSHVGFSYGARTWLVEPGRPDRLAAIGTIGELVIEGPTVSKGYLANAGKNSKAYIQCPPWLTGTAETRLYMTGDLLRYNSDGSLDFIGRKDGMVKLRGQRIELAEVEYHIRGCLNSLKTDSDLCDGVAAEIIKPQGSNAPLLVVFFSICKQYQTDESVENVKSRLVRVVERVDEKMRERVPLYMIPGAYLQIDQIPMTTTNKTNRRALRALGSAQTLEKLAEMQPQAKEQRAPSTPMEKRLQALWSLVLDIDAESISAESSFLRIGGESITAMRLVAAARRERLALTVADIFKKPRLADLALLIASRGERAEASADGRAGNMEYSKQQPFSLLKTDDPQKFLRDIIVPIVSAANGDEEFDIASIRNVVPATDFQALSATQALQDPPDRYVHWIFDLPADIDLARLEQACLQLVRHFDILHTVFVQSGDRMWQVVLPGLIVEYDKIDAADGDMAAVTDCVCEEDLARPRKLGQSFVRFIAIKHNSGLSRLVFRISHAQFDGFSWGMVLETLSMIYKDNSLVSPPLTNFGSYIAFAETKKAQSFQYWASRLQGLKYPEWSYASDLQTESSNTNAVNNRLAIKESVPIPNISQSQYDGVSAATVFHAACAIALSRQFGQKQVVFGRLVTGRAMLPATLQNVVGPTMTEVPMMVDFSANNGYQPTVADVASHLQSQFVTDSEHETVGMMEIIKECTDWSHSDSSSRPAKDFGWRTAFQQQEELEHDDGGEINFLGGRSRVSYYEGGERPSRDRPEIYATPTKNGNWELEFEGDRRRSPEHIVREFLAKLRMVLSEC
ncbi:hypothetical protein N0V93_007465 [Gnomoniopsis smithogilvyi]|uniref:Carrier domain-containing protein n=1 Tax=Gnomoniopsis smithogilvyi TaxID=1191159 RepID=A0A9W9CWP3_9PEZI|nr:hypothetical protein N0V93_007465 [Gnomoniopsis smithogilvyi]